MRAPTKEKRCPEAGRYCVFRDRQGVTLIHETAMAMLIGNGIVKPEHLVGEVAANTYDEARRKAAAIR